jgi:hypothetical protein
VFDGQIIEKHSTLTSVGDISLEETIRTGHNTILRQLAQCIGFTNLYDAALGGDDVHVFVEVHIDDVGLRVAQIDVGKSIVDKGAEGIEKY